MMADSLGEGSGTLTAVDVSLPRLAATKTVLVKYKVADRCRLFLGDATHFTLPPPFLTSTRRGVAAGRGIPPHSHLHRQSRAMAPVLLAVKKGTRGREDTIAESSGEAREADTRYSNRRIGVAG